MTEDKNYCRQIEAAMPSIFFDSRTAEVCGRLDTFYKGDGGRLKPIGEIEVDPGVLVLEYRGRCLAMQNRNPDMPKEQANEIALCQWALELAESQ